MGHRSRQGTKARVSNRQDCRYQEFLRFLRRLNTEFPGDVPLHLVMDNYGTHMHAKVQSGLKRNPRFVPHFVPTSSSWMNLVERWFGHLDNQAIRRGVFLSVADLKASIEAFLKAWNQDPKPFVWTATIRSMQEALTRCRQTLEQNCPVISQTVQTKGFAAF